MRIAVIGTGISGLGAAWLLRQSHDITVFEAAPRPGGHAHTVMVGEQPVDTGFIVYNERNYPRLIALFDALGVATQASDMSFGVSIDAGGIEWAGDNLAVLFAQKRNLASPTHWRMLADILRFNRKAKALLADAAVPVMSLGAFLEREGYGAAFRARYLVPMAAAIWSAPTATLLDFPLASFLHFFNNHGLLDVKDRPRWRTVTGGSRSYVDKILADLDGRVRLNTPIERVQRGPSDVQVTDSSGNSETFDQVIFAAHADQSRAMLADADGEESRLLDAFGFQPNRALLHTDAALMPRRRAVWSSWNYLADSDVLSEQDVSVTYWMNRLQAIPGPTQYFVSLNPLCEPDPAKLIGEIHYRHPIFDAGAIEAQRQLPAIQGKNRAWFCGAWCGYGFHEDGLAAAERVVRALGVTPPWDAVDA